MVSNSDVDFAEFVMQVCVCIGIYIECILALERVLLLLVPNSDVDFAEFVLLACVCVRVRASERERERERKRETHTHTTIQNKQVQISGVHGVLP